MKYVACWLTVASLSFAALAQQPDGNQVVASAQGQNLTLNDIALAVGLAWFMTTQMPTEAEIQTIAEHEVAEFQANPKEFRQGADFVGQLLTQATKYTNPIEVGLYRMGVINEIWAAIESVPADQRGYLLNFIFERNPVLAYDRENKMVFTAADGVAAMRYLMFVNGITDPTDEQLKAVEPTLRTLAENYVAMPLESKQQLAVASLMWQVVGAYWAQLNADQKQQMLAQLQQQQQTAVTQQPAPVAQGNYENMDPESLRILSEISQMQHMTSMNIIENIGGTGNYWEIVDQPW